MGVTVSALIDEVLGELASWSLDEEQSATLAADVTSTALTFSVVETRGIATGITPGIVELDSELVYVSKLDGTTATIPPWGRGYKQTTKASHTAGSRVVSQPTYPRSKVLDALNEVLARVFPACFKVTSLETVATSPSFTYALPTDTQRVLEAQWQVPDGSGSWETVRRWRMSPGVNRSVDLADPIIAGRPIRIFYTTKPTPMTAETQDFESQTGLPIGLRDVLVLGAAAALTTSQELSRLQTSSIEQQNRSQLVAPSAALTSSRFLEQRFQTRLEEERRSLNQLYPPRLIGTWR